MLDELAASQPSATCGLWPVAESVKTGRDFTRAVLSDWGLMDLADTAGLVVSELVTNALRHGVPAGAGRFVFVEPGVARIGRMAVVDDARGSGIGTALLRFLEDEARERGAKRFTLNAQVSARGFYEKAGYQAIGPVFDDAGIPHVRMDRPA